MTGKFNICTLFLHIFFLSFTAKAQQKLNYIDKEIKGFPKIKNHNSTFQLISHGRSGELLINGNWKNAVEIADFIKSQGDLSKIKNLNIYGCEFAKGQKGLQAVAYLEKSLNVSVSASTNITGHDGDWILEVGESSDVIAVSGYNYNLQCTTPTGTSVSPTAICSGSSSTLSGTCPSGTTLTWYKAGDINSAFTNSVITPGVTTTYSPRCESGTCVSGWGTDVKVTVTTTPTGTNVSPAAICSGSSSTLSGTCAAGTLTWYKAGDINSAFTNSVVTPTTTTTYSPRCENANCTSSWGTDVKVTVTTTPSSAPTGTSVSPAAICSGSSSTLSGTCATGTLTWYTNSALTASVTSPVSPSATTTYYAACVNGTCKSPAASTPLTVTVTTSPSASPTGTSANPAAICEGYSSTLSGTCPSGSTLTWYIAGEINSAFTNSVVLPGATTTYSPRCENGTCVSGWGTDVKVTVTTIPTATSVSPAVICAGSSSTLSGTCAAGTLKWYIAGDINSAFTNSTVSPTTTTTYSSRCENANCTSSWGTDVKVVVSTLDSDGDGKCDLLDLDDDNDGITDINEGYCETQSVYTLDVPTTVSGAAINAQGGTFNLVYKLTSGPAIAAIAGNTFNVPFTYSDFNNTATTQDHQWEGINAINYLVGNHIAIRPVTNLLFLNLPTNNTTSENTFLTSAVSPDDLYRKWLNTNAISKLGTYTATVGAIPFMGNATNSYLLDSIKLFSDFNTNNTTISAPSGYYSKMQMQNNIFTGGGANTLPLKVTHGNTYTFDYTAFSNTNGVGPSNTGVRGLIEIAQGTVVYCNHRDTDGDGIPNYLDLDSDGDGCSDAIEGGAAFKTTDLVPSSMPGGNSSVAGSTYNGTVSTPVINNLGNTVSSTTATIGIPTSAGTGQSIGSSQDKTVLDPCCGLLPPTGVPTSVCQNGTIAAGTCAVGTLTYFSNAALTTTVTSATMLATAGTYYAACVNTVSGVSCTSTSTTIIVKPSPTAPTITPTSTTICSGTTTNLVATGCSGVVNWLVSGSSTIIYTGTTFPASPTSTTNYVATCTINGCVSSVSAITTITVITASGATMSASSTTLCNGGTVTFTGTCVSPGVMTWYKNGSTTSFATGLSGISDSPTATSTYKAVCTTTGTGVNAISCATSTTTITITVQAAVAPPTVSPTSVTICNGNSTTISGSCSGAATISWTTGETTPSINVSPTATTTYSAVCNLNGCSSAIGSSVVTVTPTPLAPTSLSANPMSICVNSSTDLSATCESGTTLKWYSDVVLTTLVGTGSPLNQTLTTVGDKTYYAVCVNGNCVSSSTSITITVKNIPIITDIIAPICSDASNWFVAFTTSGTNTSTVTTTAGTLVPYSTRADGTSAWAVNAIPNATTSITVNVTENGCTTSKTYNRPADCTTVVPNALPVKLISFTGIDTNEGVLLNWKTSEEVNSDYFEIQRSSDAINFNAIGQVKSNGYSNATKNYDFVDITAAGNIIYYRLKSVDYDEKFELSKIISVIRNANANSWVYPNPTDNNLLYIKGIEGKVEHAKLTDNKGYEQKLEFTVESNNELTFNLPSRITSGSYMLMVYTNIGIVTKKIIISR